MPSFTRISKQVGICCGNAIFYFYMKSFFCIFFTFKDFNLIMVEEMITARGAF